MALIFIIEDDPNIREIETIALKSCNYEVEAFDCASSFFAQLDNRLPDLILLDIMLPDEDGYSILRKIRSCSRNIRLPIIMVTAKTTEIDMVKGLDSGADDYIKKPFSILELQSRVKALLRRASAPTTSKILELGPIHLDHERHSVSVSGDPLLLTFKEYELLRYLMDNADLVLSRESIMTSVWGTDFEGESRTVDMHIKTLRHKLGACAGMIKTVRGVGYVISENRGQDS